MLQQINEYLAEIKAFQPDGPAEAEQFRIRFLGRKGLIPALFEEFKALPREEKRTLGKELNQLKQAAEEKVKAFKSGFVSAAHKTRQDIDLSLPGEPSPTGGRHPISLVEQEIIGIFSRLGFNVAEGPEIEDDWHNFSALNFPAEHPARDMQDTFFIRRTPEDSSSDMALRTHTSSVQVRLMENGTPPFRSIMPGRVYRNEAISARAHVFFHQVEGLYIDRQVSFADLKQTLFYFVQELFGTGTGVRFRPSYFPFTEPSAEMDISCTICGGEGCAMCKHTGWVEILGCGMVDPNVLDNCGIDPAGFSGFAFGMGIERITNLKYQVKDLRLFSENDVRFLAQFQSEIVR